MSDAQITEPLMTPSAAAGWRSSAALLVAVVAAAAFVALALFFRRQGAGPAYSPGALGVRYGVQLQNGQMFYGLLREMGPRHLQLEDVYYVQPFTTPQGGQGNRVVSRQKADWHGPQSTTIPLDRVVTIEPVGGASQLAKLIEQDKAAR
jgi:hypothetical protein